MRDRFNRNINYMRISLTDLCNIRCRYCMPESGVEKLCHSDILSVEEITEISKIAVKNGIEKIRLTGGEPLIRKGFLEICKNLSEIDGLKEICITTNGILFNKYANELSKSKVRRINFSLDTMDDKKYFEITRGGNLKDVLVSLENALKIGFKVKVNTVLIGGFNDDEVMDFVNLTKENDIQVRFIELMQIGESANWSKDKFISNDEVLKIVPSLKSVGVDGVARVYKIDGYKGTVGLISPISNCFCEDCNRIRITSDGKLKPCLHSKDEINLKNLKGEELELTFKEAIFGKPESHNLILGKSESLRDMNKIGG